MVHAANYSIYQVSEQQDPVIMFDLSTQQLTEVIVHLDPFLFDFLLNIIEFRKNEVLIFILNIKFI